MQKLIAIGTGTGIVRIFGDVGVDYCLYHKTEAPVTNIQFLINEVIVWKQELFTDFL